MPKAGMTLKVESARPADVPGPFVGQWLSNPGQSTMLLKILTPSPPSQGTENMARVEERAKEGGEEHDLGEDEPHHAHAE